LSFQVSNPLFVTGHGRCAKSLGRGSCLKFFIPFLNSEERTFLIGLLRSFEGGVSFFEAISRLVEAVLLGFVGRFWLVARPGHGASS